MYKTFSRFNYIPAQKKHREHITEKSLTVPDKSLSLKVLIERYVRGQEVRQLEPQYTGITDFSQEIPEFEKMEKTERIDALRTTQESVKQMQRQLQQQKAVKEAAKQKAMQDAKQKQDEERIKAAQQSAAKP